MKYRKKPVVIEAVRWRGDNKDEIKKLMTNKDARHYFYSPQNKLCIHTLEGLMKAEVGDWIIKGVKGEIYPCKPDIFEQTYEAVVE